MLGTLRHLFVLAFFLIAPAARAQSGGVLHFCLHGEPKTFNPILVDDEASENIRYLTGGVLIRLNRQTQALESGLATSWRQPRFERLGLPIRSEEHTSELQSHLNLVCRLLLQKKKKHYS